jgi:hypothetical protein
MPTTRQNVAWIHDRNPKYSPAQILEFLNEIHKICYNQDIDQFLAKDTATGMPPFLVTTDSVYTYDCPDDCRKTSKIFVSSRDYGYVRSYYINRTIESTRFEEIFWNGKRWYCLPYVTQTDALRDASILATVTFGGNFNPGTTSTKYYHLYWKLANDLTTIDDEMQLPEELHFSIRKAISAYMATEDYGETAADEAAIERCKRMVRNKLNKGANGRVGRTNWRLEYRDF